MYHIFARFFVFLLFVVPGIPVFAQEPADTGEKQRIVLEARLSEGGPTIDAGVEWRVFNSKPGPDGEMSLLASAYGGIKAFDITPGEYLVHAAYGHAGVVKKIIVGSQPSREEFNLNAGGLKLQAIAAINTPIIARYLRFDIYSKTIGENGQRKLFARNIKPDEIVAFPVGTYHVVSKFGNLNAEVRADLRVEPGKLTEANLTHRAALITFRLVRTEGGDAIADTAWSILTENGDVIEERASTFPTMVLAEGSYTAIAKNNEMIYSQDFKVRSGLNADVEILALN